MKLAVEVTTCTVERTGVGYYTEHLVDALIATAPPGDEVTLIGNRELAPIAARKWAGRLRTGGVQLRYLWMQRDAGRMLEEAGADFALFPNYLAPLAAPCPYVNVVHDLALIRTPHFFNARKRALVRPLLPIVARGAVAVGTVSEASRRDVVALLGVPEERVVMLPGAPHPACRPPDTAAIARVRARYGIARPYVLTVGTLEPRKNLPMLVAAWREVRKRHRIDLVIAGRMRADAPAIAEEPGLRVVGEVPDEKLAELYSAALAFVYPSLYEGFGLPVLEAMQCGAGVIASRAVTEAGGEAAVYADDPASFARAMSHAVEQPGWQAERGALSLARAREFSWERTARRTYQVYLEARKRFES
jgi:glycosyltransferase involved in cell wall biosynthesis